MNPNPDTPRFPSPPQICSQTPPAMRDPQHQFSSKQYLPAEANEQDSSYGTRCVPPRQPSDQMSSVSNALCTGDFGAELTPTKSFPPLSSMEPGPVQSVGGDVYIGSPPSTAALEMGDICSFARSSSGRSAQLAHTGSIDPTVLSEVAPAGRSQPFQAASSAFCQSSQAVEVDSGEDAGGGGSYWSPRVDDTYPESQHSPRRRSARQRLMHHKDSNGAVVSGGDGNSSGAADDTGSHGNACANRQWMASKRASRGTSKSAGRPSKRARTSAAAPTHQHESPFAALRSRFLTLGVDQRLEFLSWLFQGAISQCLLDPANTVSSTTRSAEGQGSILKPQRPALIHEDDEQEFEVEEILRERYRGRREFHVKWAPTWEPASALEDTAALVRYRARLARKGLSGGGNMEEDKPSV